LPGEQRKEVPLLLLVRAGVEDRGPGPPDADLVRGTLDARTTQLVVDDELVDGVGGEPVGLGPVRCHVSGLGELTPARGRVLAPPSAHGQAPRVVLGRQIEVHARRRYPDRWQRSAAAGDAYAARHRPHRTRRRVDPHTPKGTTGCRSNV